MSSVPAPHRKTRKLRRTGRHCTPSPLQRSVKIIGVAVPAIAVAGAFLAYQADQPRLDPVASSMASYHLRPFPSGSAAIDAAGQSRVAQPASSGKPRAAGQPGQPVVLHPSPASTASPSAKQSSGGQSGGGQSGGTSGARTLTCTGAGGTGMLPLNYATIVNFVVAHGYTDMAAAGIAGNMYQESDGNPESVGSGGGGLIGWTPLPAGFVTGNAAADLQTQLEALLTYNQGWAQYIPMLNAATSPAAAADVYMNYFERPGLPAAANREGAAVAVAQACGITS